MTITKEVKSTIIKMVGKGRSVEDITVLLFMNDEYDTKAKCREAVNEVLTTENMVPVKKKPMSVQLKEWFLAQPDPLALTKDDIKKQIDLLGMSGGRVKWYLDMYTSAIDLANKINKK